MYDPWKCGTSSVTQDRTRQLKIKENHIQMNVPEQIYPGSTVFSREEQIKGRKLVSLGCRVVTAKDESTKLYILMRFSNNTITREICEKICEKHRFYLTAIKVSSGDCYCSAFVPKMLGVACWIACKRGDCSKNHRFVFYKAKVSEVNSSCGAISLAQPGTWQPIALASYPGSGNTWTRHLLQYATGQFTGSVYRSGDLYMSGFLGELEDYKSGSTITIKSHVFLPNCTGAILLIRNPFDAVLSHFNFKMTSSHVNHVEESSLQGKEWRNFAMYSIGIWSDFIFKWLLDGPNVLVVYYEDILDDVSTEIRRMVKFLTNAYPTKDRLQCTVEWQEGLFHRKGKNRNNLDYYDQEMQNLFMRHIIAVSMALQAYKQISLPNSYSPKGFKTDSWPLLETEMSLLQKRIFKGKQLIRLKNA
ncbi:WSC domain-containing protein 2-like isoform X2 [Branchiostoma floridae]|uniref:Sulfotransferase n=1 Tax=Branchiostoma floridae TaxID=7739 RepID=A0A9J7MAN0_BRAFL|nr:WSC domain-containing protein 2-like isoform X2 [Branchiostoma floridae]